MLLKALTMATRAKRAVLAAAGVTISLMLLLPTLQVTRGVGHREVTLRVSPPAGEAVTGVHFTPLLGKREELTPEEKEMYQTAPVEMTDLDKAPMHGNEARLRFMFTDRSGPFGYEYTAPRWLIIRVDLESKLPHVAVVSVPPPGEPPVVSIEIPPEAH